jgi:hypothetical protein
MTDNPGIGQNGRRNNAAAETRNERHMNHLALTASLHYGLRHSYGLHPGYGYGHGSGWITHMIISSVIHGMIYSVIFRILSHLSLSEAVLLVVVVIALIYAANRNRGYRRW